jgi:hypothetical protein
MQDHWCLTTALQWILRLCFSGIHCCVVWKMSTEAMKGPASFWLIRYGGSSRFLRYAGNYLPDYMASYFKRNVRLISLPLLRVTHQKQSQHMWLHSALKCVLLLFTLYHTWNIKIWNWNTITQCWAKNICSIYWDILSCCTLKVIRLNRNILQKRELFLSTALRTSTTTMSNVAVHPYIKLRILI